MSFAHTTIPVSHECERNDCDRESTTAFIVTGDSGTDGIAAYCPDCSEKLERSPNHTPISEVDHDAEA